LFGLTGAVAGSAFLRGDVRLLALAVATLGAVATWRDLFEAAWVARIDERYATSRLVAVRLRWRGRRRERVRRSLPAARVTARVSSVVLGVTLATALGLTGGSVPADPPAWLEAVRVATHALSFVAMASLAFVVIATRCVGDWDRAAASPLCPSPIVSGRELAARLSREQASAVARMLLLAPLIVAWLS
jgi:hypothetical protein